MTINALKQSERTKSDIDTLRREYYCLDEDDARSVLGGGHADSYMTHIYYFVNTCEEVIGGIFNIGNYNYNGERIDISGGYLQECKNGTVYIPEDNSGFAWFYGVNMSTGLVASGAGFQLNGTIHISQEWLDSGFNIYDFAHEYGHYIQQQKAKGLSYLVDIAIPSTINIIINPSSHDEQWYEQNATQLGTAHYNANFVSYQYVQDTWTQIFNSWKELFK
jgi:hypothetical protein